MPRLPLAARSRASQGAIRLEIADERQQEPRAVAAAAALVIAPQLVRHRDRVELSLLDQVAEVELHDREQRERVVASGALVEPVAERGERAVRPALGPAPEERQRAGEVAAVADQVPVAGKAMQAAH